MIVLYNCSILCNLYSYTFEDVFQALLSTKIDLDTYFLLLQSLKFAVWLKKYVKVIPFATSYLT